MKRTLITTVLAASLIALSLAGCSTPTTEPVTLSDAAVIVDVRTEAEYAEGHLEGAQLLDVTSPNFDAELKELESDGEYFVYCRSGNRSASAVQTMKTAGFSDVTDLGSMSNAADSTGLAIVR